MGRSLTAGTVGAALPIGALALRNQRAFGGFARTGYSMTNEPADFGWCCFAEHFLPYLQQSLAEGAGSVLGLGPHGSASCSTTPRCYFTEWRRWAPTHTRSDSFLQYQRSGAALNGSDYRSDDIFLSRAPRLFFALRPLPILPRSAANPRPTVCDVWRRI